MTLLAGALIYVSFSFNRRSDDSGPVKPDQLKDRVLDSEDHYKSRSVPNVSNGREQKRQSNSQLPTQPDFIAQILSKAEQGSAEAQNKVGGCYANGQFVGRNDIEAVKWFRKAAEQGHAEAQFNLGVMYIDGRGVEKSEGEAIKWYRKAAENGDIDAQMNLASRYEQGRGVPKDDSEVFKWFRKAAEQGNSSAEVRVGDMYLSGRGVPANEEEAAKWFRKAAGQANASAQTKLNAIDNARLRHLPADDRLTSGALLVDRLRNAGKGKLTLDNGLTADAYVKLVQNDKLVAAFYVRSYDAFTYPTIPDGSYTVIYCTGFGWDGTIKNFARGRHACRYDDPLTYITRQVRDGRGVTTYTDVVALTLHKVDNGNAKSSNMSLEEFDRY